MEDQSVVEREKDMKGIKRLKNGRLLDKVE